jgi:hypothetical protein
MERKVKKIKLCVTCQEAGQCLFELRVEEVKAATNLSVEEKNNRIVNLGKAARAIGCENT